MPSLAHDGLAEREVLVEPVEQLGESIAERLLVLALAQRVLQREPQQQRVVGVADDSVVAVGDRIVGRDDVRDHAGGDFSHRPWQVLVVHRVERNLQVMG